MNFPMAAPESFECVALVHMLQTRTHSSNTCVFFFTHSVSVSVSLSYFFLLTPRPYFAGIALCAEVLSAYCKRSGSSSLRRILTARPCRSFRVSCSAMCIIAVALWMPFVHTHDYSSQRVTRRCARVLSVVLFLLKMAPRLFHINKSNILCVTWVCTTATATFDSCTVQNVAKVALAVVRFLCACMSLRWFVWHSNLRSTFPPSQTRHSTQLAVPMTWIFPSSFRHS